MDLPSPTKEILSATRASITLEAEVLPGLEEFALEEIRERCAGSLIKAQVGSGSVAFLIRGYVPAIYKLRTVVSVYRSCVYKIPRPRALLGQEHFDRLLLQIAEVRRAAATLVFESFRLSAAGKESQVFQRIAKEIEIKTGLKYDAERGDLLIRLRKAECAPGWELLIRLTPRPLSSREWRIANMRGAINATIAAVIARKLRSKRKGVFLNPMCGSGTLLIEYFKEGSGVDGCIGGDLCQDALRVSVRNLSAAGCHTCSLVAFDAAALPFRDASVSTLAADLPWGEALGDRRNLHLLYESFWREVSRVAESGARLAVVTQDVASFDNAAGQYARGWRESQRFKVLQGGFHPAVIFYDRI